MLDRFGDVYAFDTKSDIIATVPNGGKKEDDDEEEEAGEASGPVGKLILGHVSMLTCGCMPDNQTIITGDRDEHIRVSNYPDGHNIARYCLGHEEFITSLHVPAFAPDTLISGSGDSFILLWDWKSGKPIQQIALPGVAETDHVAVSRIVSHAASKTVAIAFKSTLLMLKPIDKRGRLEISETIELPAKIPDVAFDSQGRTLVCQPDGIYIYNGIISITQDPLIDAIKTLEPMIVDKRDSLPLDNLRKGTKFGKALDERPPLKEAERKRKK